MNKLISQVEQWAKDRNLDKASPRDQFLKITEEIGEVSAALARSDKRELEDGIGDTLVTLIIFAMQNDMKLKDCLELAYNEIKDRKGKMIDGVFIKEDDL